MHSVLFALFGLCLGSFTTALIYRIPRNISWVYSGGGHDPNTKTSARSYCPNCNATLTFFDLVPLFSWLCSRGKCRHCKQKISSFYPVVELFVMVVVVLLSLVWDKNILLAIIVSLYIPFLTASLAVTTKGMTLPNDIVMSFVFVSFVYVCGAVFFIQTHPDWAFLQTHLASGFLLAIIVVVMSYVLKRIKKDSVFDEKIFVLYAAFGAFLGLEFLASFVGLTMFIYVFMYFLSRKNLLKTSLFGVHPPIISFFVHLFLTGIGFYSRV